MRRAATLSLAVFILVSVGRVSGGQELTSSGTAASTLRLAVPLLLVGLGGLFAERTGIVNIGLEGMMIAGTWFAAWGGVRYGPWWGVVLGVAGGAIGGSVHALATVRAGIDHIVSGIAINFLAAGATRFLSALTYEGDPGGGGVTQSPRVAAQVGRLTLPILSGGHVADWHSPDLLGWIERKRWFLVSDVAGPLKGATTETSWLTVVALVLIPASAYLLWRTPLGLRLRSSGENPQTAHSLGVHVSRMRIFGVVLSGALAGLGGAHLVLEGAGVYREGQTAGRGFIGLAALVFGNWRPLGVACGAVLFGFADALQLRQEAAVHALLLPAGLALVAGAGWELLHRRFPRVILFVVAAGAMFVAYAALDTIPRQLLFFTPHLVTLAVLAFAGQRLRPPAAVGHTYRAESA
jgi:simple sugar transport system permease protein